MATMKQQFGSWEKQKYLIYLKWNSINVTILILYWVDSYSINKEYFWKNPTANYELKLSDFLCIAEVLTISILRQKYMHNGLNKKNDLTEGMFYLHEDFANILYHSSFYGFLCDIIRYWGLNNGENLCHYKIRIQTQ